MEALRQRLSNRISRKGLADALPLAALALFTVCVLLMIVQVVLPQWRAMRSAATELAAARVTLIQAESAYTQAPSQAQTQVANLQEQLESAATGLFSEDEAARLRNRLFDYAAANDVAINAMEPGATAGEDAACVLDTTRVQVRGSLSGLLGFVGAFSESQVRGFRLSGLAIAADGDQHVLTMDLLLVTSAWAPPLDIATPVPAATPAISVTPSSQGSLLVRPQSWPTDWPWPPATPATP
ncbi:MAG: hypothetical protein ACYC4R_16200 [Anaerolineae bacterium]